MSKITESARGEECLVRLANVCSFDPAKTIWSHARWVSVGRGKAIKADDLLGAYCCTSCDRVFDGGSPYPAPYTCRADVDLDWMMGHLRSLLRLKEKGLL